MSKDGLKVVFVFFVIVFIIDMIFTFKGAYIVSGNELVGAVLVLLINGLILSTFGYVLPIYEGAKIDNDNYKGGDLFVFFILLIFLIFAGIVDIFTSYHGFRIWIHVGSLDVLSEEMMLNAIEDPSGIKNLISAFLCTLTSIGSLMVSYLLFEKKVFSTS